jgi:tetratricopeptide (TPR) repeat protein
MTARKSLSLLRLAPFAAVFLIGGPLAAAPALAFGTAPSSKPAKVSTPASPEDSAAMAAKTRASAEALYKRAWEDSEAGKADLKKNKPKDANKKFAKALKRYDEATRLDPTYFEAWNMVGYCSRLTGDLKRSFAAYDKALQLKPDFDEAHEYLGEAYLMSGDIAKAKEQLAWLKEKQSAEAAELEEAIEAAEKGQPADQAGKGW